MLGGPLEVPYADPDETINRAGNSPCSAIVAEMRSELRRIVDPEAADRQAKADQRALVMAGARSHSEWEQKARRRPLMHDLPLTAYPKWHPQ